MNESATDDLQPNPNLESSMTHRKLSIGGYDCKFVEPPPKAFQTECSVCLQILKEPCLMSCCGNKFCRECIQQVQKDRRSCPLCNTPDFTFMQDRGLKRSLSDFEVWCSNKEDGCKWRGKLGGLEKHLNQGRSTAAENQLNGCQSVKVKCMNNCGEWFQRRYIATHETEQCKNRRYSCDYCRDYSSTFEDVTEVHYPQCGKYPIACPNDCDVYMIERQDLETHLKDQCPLELIVCPIDYAGCGTQLPRKDMPEHMRENPLHIKLLATFTQKLSMDMEKLAERNQKLQQQVQRSEQLLQECFHENKTLEDEIKKLSMRTFDGDEHKIVVTNAMEEMKQRIVFDTTAELSHIRDKMEGMKMQFEHQLHDREEMLLRDASIANHHLLLHNNTRAVEYEMPSNLGSGDEVEVRRMYLPTFPVEFTLTQFHKKYSENSITWYSQPFYTHSQGYRMCIVVKPNSGLTEIRRKIHACVIVSICIVEGPFDARLKWPFRGILTIQIVNQSVDHRHFSETIHYTNMTPHSTAGRVVGAERARRGGNILLPHSIMGFNHAKNTQYLKDDCLIIRVTKVVLT